MNVEQVGQQSFANSATRNSSPLKFLLSSPIEQPGKIKHSQDTWTADFLTDLRSKRPARPSGARPLPVRHAHTTPFPTLEPPARTASALSRPSYSMIQPDQLAGHSEERSSSSMSHCRAKSALSMREQVGRPLVQQPLAQIDPDLTIASSISDEAIGPKKAADTVVNGAYMERGHRWMEKQEARSLRAALEDMDLREEQRLHAAAQEEATNIIWKHRNAGVPYRNPGGPRDYKQHLRKGSHARSQSIERYGVLGKMSNICGTVNRSASDGSTSTKSGGDSSERSRESSGSCPDRQKPDDAEIKKSASRNATKWDSPDKKDYTNLTCSIPPAKISNRRASSGPRTRATGLTGRPSLFRNPEDQIYEEPEEIVPQILTDDKTIAETKPLKPTNRNPSISAKEQTNTISKLTSVPIGEDKKFSRYEIHKNPPSRSRDPSYLQNFLTATSQGITDVVLVDTGNNKTPTKHGIEIRSNEIREATSMRLKDRSPKLPTPTVVSDRPGRPIVSFDRDYKPREVELQHESSFSEQPSSRNEMIQLESHAALKPQLPASVNSAPLIPTINVLEPTETEVCRQADDPTINFPDVPSISITHSEYPAIVSDNVVSSARPLPKPINGGRSTHGHRPGPHHSATAPVTATKSHWTPVLQRATAQCAACALPISGRIVSRARSVNKFTHLSGLEGIKEVQIIQWFVEPGARVEQFDKLCEVQSDKAATEITSRFDGVIKKLHYEAEDMAQVGKPLCDIDIQGEISPEDEALITPSADQAGTPSDAQQPQKTIPHELKNSVEHRIGDPLPKRADPGVHASLATPAVRGLLKELAVKIEDVEGTGKDGRVLKDDVHKFAAARDSPSQRMKIPSATPKRSSDSGSQNETVIQLTPIQSHMFKTMTRSLSIPHFLFADEINLNALESLRARLNSLPSTARRLSYLPFIIKAVSVALKDFPLLNSRVEYDPDIKGVPPRLVVRENHNIGVAMDTSHGLLVPNIKDVGSLSVPEIADQLKHLQNLAQASKLKANDLTGGTITVSNIGSIGGTYVAPIIVQSEVAILGVGRAMVVPAFDKEGGIVKKTVGNFSWSADHRVVDGATMARMAGRQSVFKGTARVPYNLSLHSAEPPALMADAGNRTAGRRWTSDQEAEFKNLCGQFQATPSDHQEAYAVPPAARSFVRPRACSPNDRNRPHHVPEPGPPFSAIVASYERRFGTLPYRGPPAPVAAAAAAPAPAPAPTTPAAARGSEPDVSGAYAATTPPDRDFFTRGPPQFPAGHNHYQVSEEVRKAWYTAGSPSDQAQEK
ncbi:hypothetical protein MMC26_004116 [Xylographa opegraphella]|nr:hypothetical protein [Xylographa opegraphella]